MWIIWLKNYIWIRIGPIRFSHFLSKIRFRWINNNIRQFSLHILNFHLNVLEMCDKKAHHSLEMLTEILWKHYLLSNSMIFFMIPTNWMRDVSVSTIKLFLKRIVWKLHITKKRKSIIINGWKWMNELLGNIICLNLSI